MNEKHKKIISIDLDGVLNDYVGDYLEYSLPPIKNGAYEFLEKLTVEFNVEIFTVRNKVLVQKWVEENNLTKFIKSITNIKNPYVSIFVDDRALTFNGDFKILMTQILDFKPYWKN